MSDEQRNADIATLARVVAADVGLPNFGAPGYAALSRQLPAMLAALRFVEEHGYLTEISLSECYGLAVARLDKQRAESLKAALAALAALRKP